MIRRPALALMGGAVLTTVLAPAVACADAGGPILYLMFADMLLFGYGQVWIVLVEFLYLRRVFPEVPGKRVLGWVFLANLVSLAIGMLLFVLTLPLFIEVFGPGRDVSTIFLLGWLIGMMIPTYFLSVLIEWLVVRNRARKVGEVDGKRLLVHSFWFNLISYAGLIALCLGLLLYGV